MCTRRLCAATGFVVMTSVICVFAVVGSPAPISVTGSQAPIKEISEVKKSLFEVNNRINISGIGIGSVLLVVVLVMMGSAPHHIFVKKPNRILKRERSNQTEERIKGLEDILKERGLPCLKQNLKLNLCKLGYVLSVIFT